MSNCVIQLVCVLPPHSVCTGGINNCNVIPMVFFLPSDWSWWWHDQQAAGRFSSQNSSGPRYINFVLNTKLGSLYEIKTYNNSTCTNVCVHTEYEWILYTELQWYYSCMGGGDYPLIYVSENTTYVVHACGLIFDVCSIDGSEISGERGVTICGTPADCRVGRVCLNCLVVVVGRTASGVLCVLPEV